MNFNEPRKQGTHTEDEMRLLTIEENMGELRRAQFIIQKGLPLQKPSIYLNLHILSKFNGFSLLMPILRDDLLTQDEDILAIAAKQFLAISKQLLEKDQLFLLHFSHVCFKQLRCSVADEWFDLFALLYPLDLPASTKLAQELSDADAEVTHRIRGARLMRYVPQIEILQLLCVDNSPEVRFHAVKSIQLCFEQFSEDKFNAYLSMKIYELIYDHEPHVRMAAIEMFFAVQSKLDDRQKIVCKYFYEFLTSSNVQVMTVMSRICGRVFLDIQDLSPDITKFIKILHQFAESSLEEIRVNFAYNFAGVMQILEGQCFDHFRDTYIDSLLYDSSLEVKAILMAHLPDVIRSIGIHKAQILVGVIKKLLPNQIVQYNLRSLILAFWCQDTPEQSQMSKQSINELLKDLTRLLTFKSVNQSILSALLGLHDQLQFCDSYMLLLTPLLHLLQADSHQIRILVSQNLAHLAYHDQQIHFQMQSLCLNSKKFRMRINYIEFINQTINLCSKKYFQVNGLLNILSLAQDKVIDVRIRLARIMKKINLILNDDDEQAIAAYTAAYKLLSRDRIIQEVELILSKILNLEVLNFTPSEESGKEQKEFSLNVRHSMDDLEELSPLVPLQRKRSSGSRPAPVSRYSNQSFAQKSSSGSKPRLEERKLPLKPAKPQTSFKPKITSSRPRK